MGSCVSMQKSPQESAMKLGLSFESKTDNLIIPPSPVKEKPAANGHLTLKSQSPYSFKDFGSKEETFFDSRAYLDSDCEDDFFSVNGEFTPSRGNTPVHHSFSVGTPRVNKATVDGSPFLVSETSPTGKKKKLLELFRESVRENGDVNELNTSSNHGTPYVSVLTLFAVVEGQLMEITPCLRKSHLSPCSVAFLALFHAVVLMKGRRR
ncbi:putative adenylate kinase 1 [Hibiscus syriacus]|uniref:Adenylate kinase 1 n=1 Tax=Hibiscus syriacus TaxID=106335 RepID=A0A6A2ZR50_HIBSY|nr:putative adenylate kinase 1 [Hibiscus syriacus]